MAHLEEKIKLTEIIPEKDLVVGLLEKDFKIAALEISLN